MWKQFVIVSTTSFDKNNEYNFRNWKYITIKIIVVFQKTIKNLYLNIECTMSFINKKWFHVLNFNVIVRQIIDFIKIRDIDNREYFNFDYINLNFYLKNKFKKKISIIYIKKNMYIINNLKIKILIDIDIIYSKKITTNLQTRKLIIDNCDISTSIIYILVDFKVNRIARFHHVVIIFAYSILIVSFKTQNFALSNEKNYFFQSHVISFDFEVENDIIIYIINVKTFVIHVRNAIDKSIIVFKHIKFDKIFDFEKKSCYHVDSTNVYLTIDVNWKRRVVIALIDFVVIIISMLIKIKLIALSIYIVISIITYIVASIITIYFVVSIIFLKITTSNDIIIYETSFEIQHKLQNIAKIFLIIWKNNDDIINVLKKNWISMKTIFETKSKSSRVYFVESQNRDFIDKKFDKLYNKKKMSWIIEITFFDISIFVV